MCGCANLYKIISFYFFIKNSKQQAVHSHVIAFDKCRDTLHNLTWDILQGKVSLYYIYTFSYLSNCCFPQIYSLRLMLITLVPSCRLLFMNIVFNNLPIVFYSVPYIFNLFIIK